MDALKESAIKIELDRHINVVMRDVDSMIYMHNDHTKKLVKKILTERCFIAGGAIRSILSGENINDLDIFVDNEIDAYILYSCLKERADVTSTNALTKRISLSQTDRATGNYVLGKYYKSSFQIIVRTWGEPLEVLNTFDFTNSMGFYHIGTKSLYVSPEMSHSILTKELHFHTNTINYPFGIIQRTGKFIKQGYTISLAEHAKIVYKLLCTPMNKFFEVPDRNGY